MHFPSDVGHDNGGMSFLVLKDRTTKYGKPDSWSVMLLRKHLVWKEKKWKWIKEISFKMESGSHKGRGLMHYHSSQLTQSRGRRKFFFQPGNSKLLSSAANEMSPSLQTLIFLQWTFVQNNPSPLAPFLYEGCSPLFSSLTFADPKLQFLYYSWINSGALRQPLLFIFFKIDNTKFSPVVTFHGHFALWCNFENELYYIPCPMT